MDQLEIFQGKKTYMDSMIGLHLDKINSTSACLLCKTRKSTYGSSHVTVLSQTKSWRLSLRGHCSKYLFTGCGTCVVASIFELSDGMTSTRAPQGFNLSCGPPEDDPDSEGFTTKGLTANVLTTRGPRPHCGQEVWMIQFVQRSHDKRWWTKGYSGTEAGIGPKMGKVSSSTIHV